MDDPKQSSVTLDQLSLHDLRDLRARVDRAIRDFDQRRRQAALAAAEEAMRAHGFTMADVLRKDRRGSSRSRPTPPSAVPLYANPDDRAKTWSGRGRRPAWVKAALEQGKTLEDLAV